jgi:hypothetical protein
MALIAGKRMANRMPIIETVKTISTNVKDFLFLFSFDV